METRSDSGFGTRLKIATAETTRSTPKRRLMPEDRRERCGAPCLVGPYLRAVWPTART
jgi:hypothetical protein